MRVLFAGTPDFAVPSLNALSSSNHSLVAVLTNPDRPSGRGRQLHASPVKVRALELGIPVLQPPRLDAYAREQVSALRPELLVVVAYGRIFGPRFLECFPEGGVNLHPSLLPLHRGPAPIPAAILSGAAVSGISVQKLALQMDAGDILIQEEFPLTDEDTAASLGSYCAERGAQLLVKALDGLEAGSLIPRPQDESRATYCSLLAKEDGHIDWSMSADSISRLVRAFLPWPLAHSSWEGRGINILSAAVWKDSAGTGAKAAEPGTDAHRGSEREPGQAALRPNTAEPGTVLGVDKSSGILVQTGNGILVLKELQIQSRKAMDWKSFLNGNPQFISSRLGG